MDSHIVGIYYDNYWHLLDFIIPFRRKSPYHHHGLSHLALHFVPSNGRFFAEVREIYVDIERERKENCHRHCKTFCFAIFWLRRANNVHGTSLWLRHFCYYSTNRTRRCIIMHYPGFRYFVNNYKPFSPLSVILIANESYFFRFLCRFLTFHENEK